MNLLGAALLTAAGLLCGLLAGAQLRDRLRQRRELCRMLSLMEFELERFRTPLPELFASLAGRLSGQAGALCARAASGLTDAGSPFSAVWREAVSGLDAREREILLPLGAVLGRYGAAEQTAAVSAARGELCRLRDETAAQIGEKSRVYAGVFTAGGLLLAVLLM